MNFRPNPLPTHDGWALRLVGSDRLLPWSLCTTREECRELLRERTQAGLFGRLAVSARPVKVRLRMEVCE